MEDPLSKMKMVDCPTCGCEVFIPKGESLMDDREIVDLFKMKAEMAARYVGYFVCDSGNIDDGGKILFSLICHDVFAWGVADCEDIGDDEVEEVYNVWKKYGGRGVDAWIAKKRGPEWIPQEAYLEQYPEYIKIREELEKK